jgi:hypothetical protein
VRDGSRSGLGPGTVVGGRFEIERAVADDALGTVLAARDQKTGRAIAVRLLAPGLIATPEALEVLRAEVKTAASIAHKSLVATYGMGSDGPTRFVAAEWVDGQTLAEVVRAKKASDEPMSLRGAYNVLAHVCKALDAAQQAGTAHGALRPSVVWVTKAGRVKVSSLGLDRALLKTAGPAALGAEEQAFLAPEVKAGVEPDPRSDVFGLGGLLYTMLTGRSAADEFVPPSLAHPEAGPEVDEVLLRCLAPDPSQRFGSPEEVRAALVALTVGTAPAHDQEDFGADVDVDVDIGSMPPPAPEGSAKPAPAKPPPPTGAPKPPPPKPAAKAPAPKAQPTPQVGARVRVDEPFAPALPAAPVLSAEVDLGQLLSKITENDAPRWMVVKDGLDHGPFSGRELVQLILKGDVLADHGLLNMDTGERRKVKEAPEFVEFTEQYKIKKAEADHKVALVQSEKREKLSFVTKGIILAAVVGVVGIGVGAFFLTRGTETEEERADAQLGDLYERGQIEITGTAGILPDPEPSERTGTRRRSSGGGGRGGLSYEDAMNQVVQIGNAAESGGQSRLSPGQVAGVMNNNINRLFTCVRQEPNVGTVRIDLAIAGSGQVLGASVRNGSPSFQSCIARQVQGIRFPTFGAPRMGASYTFSTN